MHEVQQHRLAIDRIVTPRSLEEALRLLSEAGDTARLIAGGTDLLLECKRGQRPDVRTLIDITSIDGLRRIEVGSEIALGPLVTHADVLRAENLVSPALPLVLACAEIGSPQLRNQATVVGNIVTASPANDTITPLRALDATLEIASVRGRRVVPLEKFHTGVRKTVLAPDEMVTAVRFRSMEPHERGIFLKLGLRSAQAISVVHLAAVIGVSDDRVVSASIHLGSVAPTVVRAEEAERFLVSKRIDAETARSAGEVAERSIQPIDDVRATASYRRSVTRSLVERALLSLAEGRPAWSAPVTLGPGTQPSPPETDSISATINGVQVTAGFSPSQTLLDWIRKSTNLTGTKEGCAEGECGACTVILNGEAVMSCLAPAVRASGSTITTVEGLASGGRLHPIQQAFIDQAAVQCGFCIPGFLVAGARLLEERPVPDDTDILTALSGNLCRCTGYRKIIAAVHQAGGDL